MSCNWYPIVWIFYDKKSGNKMHQVSAPTSANVSSIQRFWKPKVLAKVLAANGDPWKANGINPQKLEHQAEEATAMVCYGRNKATDDWHKDQAASVLLVSLTCTTSIGKPLLGYQLEGQSEASWVLEGLESGSDQKWDCESAWQNLQLYCSAVKTLRGKWNVN